MLLAFNADSVFADMLRRFDSSFMLAIFGGHRSKNAFLLCKNGILGGRLWPFPDLGSLLARGSWLAIMTIALDAAYFHWRLGLC